MSYFAINVSTQDYNNSFLDQRMVIGKQNIVPHQHPYYNMLYKEHYNYSKIIIMKNYLV